MLRSTQEILLLLSKFYDEHLSSNTKMASIFVTQHKSGKHTKNVFQPLILKIKRTWSLSNQLILAIFTS